MSETTDRSEQAREQARAQLESIKSMVARLEHAQECDDSDCDLTDKEIFEGSNLAYAPGDTADEETRDAYHSEDLAREAIEADPLSVEVRSGWHAPGDKDTGDAEYCILLCTGGPAARIVGELGQYSEPSSARLEYQDWFLPWAELITTGADHAALLAYARVFYFGE